MFNEPPSSRIRSRQTQQALERRHALNAPQRTQQPPPAPAGSSPNNPIIVDDDHVQQETSREINLPDADHHAEHTVTRRTRALNTSEDIRSACRTLHWKMGYKVPAIAESLGLMIAQVRYTMLARDPPQRRGRPRAVPDTAINLLFSLINTPRGTKRTMTYKNM